MITDFDSSVSGAHFGEKVRLIASFLNEHAGPHSMGEVLKALGIQEQNPRATFRRMVHSGILDNPSRGMYEISPGIETLGSRYGRVRGVK